MPSPLEQVSANLAAARALRAEAVPYREIGRRLGLTTSQLGHIRRTLKREKGGRTRLLTTMPGATARDLLVSRSALPAGLRRILLDAGFRTLGDLADRIADADQPPLESLPRLGPIRVRIIRNLLDEFALRAGSSDLQAEIEMLFPELRD